jgi:hypothetical protein
MHDPNQDRLSLRRMTYFRVKRRTLGRAFSRFLRDCLEPGGTILLSDCRLRWRSPASPTVTCSSSVRWVG